VSEQPLTKTQIGYQLRQHVKAQLYDESGANGPGFAIYALSDPRSLLEPRYIGQTADPKRRFFQHLNTARLWIPDELPWWVKSPKLRPLYEWIRALYRDNYRLPTMILREWVRTSADARLAERAQICACLERRLQLFNVEAERNSEQFLLL
jgi:hypothetical protein